MSTAIQPLPPTGKVFTVADAIEAMTALIEYDDPDTDCRVIVEYEVNSLEEAEDIAYSLSDKRMTYTIQLIGPPPK